MPTSSSQLGPTDLLTTDPAKQSWITLTPSDRSPSVQALFWDYTTIPHPPGQIDEFSIEKRFPTRRLPGGPQNRPPESRLLTKKVYRIGHDHNDPYTAYIRMGSPLTLSRDQLRQLRSITSGAPVETRSVTTKDGIFHQHFFMNQNDV